MAGEITAVGIDRDKHSQAAVKWAIDNLLSSDSYVFLIHVRVRNSSSSPGPDDLKQLFLPYRGFCARKGVRTKEVVLDDSDIPAAILAYINQNFVSNIVVGASARGFIQSWSKKYADVPTVLNKSVPEFCSLYVISKGKPVTIKTALRPPPANPSQSKASSSSPNARHSQAGPATPPKSSSQLSHDSPSYEDAMKRNWRNEGSDGRSWEKSKDYNKFIPRDRFAPNQRSPTRSNHSGESMFTPRTAYSQESNSAMSDTSEPFGYQSSETALSREHFSNASSTTSSTSMIEAEMRRLKQELKQTMEMYSTACREAITAKQTNEDYQKWQKEEADKFEEAKQAEEAALTLANLEKAKAKAAHDAAEASKKIAQLEARRRDELERKAKSAAEAKSKGANALSSVDIRYRKYEMEDIKISTGNFSESQKIGEGGYGPVFRGYLDHTPVAIKVLKSDAAQGMKQFHQEVEVLSCIRHPNMVLLLGACPEYGCLVYEYMDNGSLEDRLLMKDGSPPIPWQIRFRIAAEIATALLFLHQTKPEPLVHRDLKPGNILLDYNYRSKISDVGLARLVPPSIANSVTQYHMTSAAGTFCYIDPEYQQTGMLGTKSDIYSLGIMLLQIITAKPPMGLAHYIGRSIKKGTFREMLDPTVEDWPVEEALVFAKLALQCAELRKKDRPDLGTEILPELSRLRALGYSNFGCFRPAPNTSNSNSYQSNMSQGIMSTDPTGRLTGGGNSIYGDTGGGPSGGGNSIYGETGGEPSGGLSGGNSIYGETGGGPSGGRPSDRGHYMPSRLRDDDDDDDKEEDKVEDKGVDEDEDEDGDENEDKGADEDEDED